MHHIITTLPLTRIPEISRWVVQTGKQFGENMTRQKFCIRFFYITVTVDLLGRYIEEV